MDPGTRGEHTRGRGRSYGRIDRQGKEPTEKPRRTQGTAQHSNTLFYLWEHFKQIQAKSSGFATANKPKRFTASEGRKGTPTATAQEPQTKQK